MDSHKDKRVDVVDLALAIWAASYILVILTVEAVPAFPAGYALLFLALVMLVRRSFFSDGRRPIQMLASVILAIATAMEVASGVPDRSLEVTLIKGFVAASLLTSGAMAVRECVARALGVTTAATLDIPDLRRSFLVPGLAVAIVAIASIFLPVYWKASWVWPLVLILWLLAAGLQWFFLRTLPEDVFKFHVHNTTLWQRLLGSPRVVFPTIAGIWVMGLFLEAILRGRNYITWTLVIGLIVFHAVTLLELRKQAARIEEAL